MIFKKRNIHSIALFYFSIHGNSLLDKTEIIILVFTESKDRFSLILNSQLFYLRQIPYQTLQIHFLKNIFKEEDFTYEELNKIIPAFKESTFKKHDYLLKEGFTENHYWFVESGYIRSFVIYPA